MNPKHLPITVLAAVALALLVMLSGCIQTQETQPLKLIHQTWVGDGLIYLAKEKGILERNNVDVEILRIEGAAERRALLAGGKVDISFETVDMSIVDISIGTPEVMVLKLDESAGADGVIATEGITSIADLKGKRVGCVIGDPQYFLLRLMMKKEGVQKSEVNFLDIPAEQAGAAFVSGDIDAACTWEPWLSKAREREGGHILMSSADLPGMIVDVMVVRPEILKARREEVKAVMKSWLEAYAYLQQNPKESYEIMGNAYDLSGEEFEELVQGLKWNGLGENREFFGLRIFELANNINEIAVEDGMISAPISVQTAIDSTLVNEIRE